MARWRTWVFEVSAPLDEFARNLRRGLEVRGAVVRDAERFDLVAIALGSRAFVKLAWAEGGIQATVKLKSGLFASPEGLERMLLEAGRDAQLRSGVPREAT